MRDQEDTADVLHLVGWLKGEEADELLRVADACGPGLVLDLSELRKADAYGIVALRSLADRGVKLEQVPQLIALMLENSSA
jgi:ABC-type transporter Mla MlaB component